MNKRAVEGDDAPKPRTARRGRPRKRDEREEVPVDNHPPVENRIVGDEEVMEVDLRDIDEYDAERIKAAAAQTPEVRFNHSKFFTDDENKIIAGGLRTRMALYRIADTIHCHYQSLQKHIRETPELAALQDEQHIRECGEVEEGLNNLVALNHPGVLMWKATKLMPEKYGDERKLDEEEETRIVIGDIPDSMLAEGDRLIAGVAERPPTADLPALLDDELEECQTSVSGGGTRPQLPAPKVEKQEQESATENSTGNSDDMGMTGASGGDDFFDGTDGVLDDDFSSDPW